MTTRKQITLIQLFILLCVVSAYPKTIQAKSVYAITNHSASTLTAYYIDDDRIDYQTTAQQLPHLGIGAIGLALDLNTLVRAWATRTIPPRFSKFLIENRIFLHLRAASFVFIMEGRMYATAPTLPHPRHSTRLEVDKLSSYKGLR